MKLDVHKKAEAFNKAQAEFKKAFSAYQFELEPLSADRFWELQTVFRNAVLQYRFEYGRSHGVEQAAEEFFRKPLAGDFGGGPEYSMTEAIRFAKTWRQVSRRLYVPLFSVVEDRSDDSYGDLLDALPLAGREVAEMSGPFDVFIEYGQFVQCVIDACGSDALSKLVLHGENYIGMSLDDAALKYFAFSCQ